MNIFYLNEFNLNAYVDLSIAKHSYKSTIYFSYAKLGFILSVLVYLCLL